MYQPPGKYHKVYLNVEENGALEAYCEEQGGLAVNAVLREVLLSKLVGEGYLLPHSGKERHDKAKG